MDPRDEALNRIKNRDARREGRARREREGISRQSGGVNSEANRKAADEFEAERLAWKERNAAKVAGNSVDQFSNDDPEETQIQKGRQLQQENKESLANSIRMAKQATEIGADTAQRLSAQREQMKKIDENLDTAQESLTRSDRIIKGMKSYKGWIANMFVGPKKHKNTTLDVDSVDAAERESIVAEKRDKAARDKMEKEERERARNEAAENGETPQPGIFNRDLTNESTRTKEAIREFQQGYKEEDDMLDDLGDLLGHLKGQAQDMNHELKVQEKLVDHLTDQVDRTGSRVKHATTNVRKI